MAMLVAEQSRMQESQRQKLCEKLLVMAERARRWTIPGLAVDVGPDLCLLFIAHKVAALLDMSLIEPLADELTRRKLRFRCDPIDLLASVLGAASLPWRTAFLDAVMAPQRWEKFWNMVLRSQPQG